jgi:tetrahydromethanopterin S-methyltransferase subunit G
MKFRPTLHTLESREVPSVVTPDDQTTPPAYTPPADTGTPPVDSPIPADTPAKADDKPKEMTLDDVIAETNALNTRLDEIEKAIEGLKKELVNFEAYKTVNNLALSAAKPGYDAAKKKFDDASQALDDFVKANPNWSNFPTMKETHAQLKQSKDLAEAEYKGAKAVYDPLVILASNIQQRIDAITAGIENLEAEAKLIKVRLQDLGRNVGKGTPNFAIPPIPKAVVPTIDAVFKDWTKPLKGAPELKAPVPK